VTGVQTCALPIYSFNKSWADLLAKIASKREALAAAR
jgi:hypothetical protein